MEYLKSPHSGQNPQRQGPLLVVFPIILTTRIEYRTEYGIKNRIEYENKYKIICSIDDIKNKYKT